MIETTPDSVHVSYDVEVDRDDPDAIELAEKLEELRLKHISFVGVDDDGDEYEIVVHSEEDR